jgi:hypothetical protein
MTQRYVAAQPDLYTAEQMQAYAAAAVARQLEADEWLLRQALEAIEERYVGRMRATVRDALHERLEANE